MFNRNKKNKTQIQQPRLITVNEITEKPTIVEAFRTFSLLDVTSIKPTGAELVFSENVAEIEDEAVRIDYIMAPKKALVKLRDDRIGIDTEYARRFDDILVFLTDQSQHFFEEKPQRLITSDGWELYRHKDVPLLEVQSSVCKRCETCHERAPVYHGPKRGNTTIYSHDVRDIRTYKIQTPMQALLYKTGTVLATVEHQCRWRSLQEIITPKHEIVDPPKIKVVFPQDLQI